jgi:hypothetical protein
VISTRTKSRRLRGAGWRAVPCFVALCVAIVLAILAADAQSPDGRSSLVQAHGVRVPATVRAVSRDTHCSFFDGHCIPTTQIQVRLTLAVNGVGTTTVHFPGASHVRVGSRISVLVDPKDASYAELPRAPYRAAGGWIVLAAISALCAAIALALSPPLARALGRSRRRSAALAPEGVPAVTHDQWQAAPDATAEEVGSAGPKVGMDGRPLPRPPFEGFGPGI